MFNIDTLRAEHDAALSMAARLIDLVDNYDPATAAIPILMQLNRLLGILRVHLAREDVEIYPRLIASGDVRATVIATTLVTEMGGLATDLECFARHWSCSASIAANIDEFRESAHDLLLALAVRIEREDHYLYPLVETICVTQRDAA